MAKYKPRDIMAKGLVHGAEFAFTIIALIFLGYYVGSQFNEIAIAFGVVAGATVGFAVALYRLITKANSIKPPY
jgi:Ni,Fe-hydrogenase I cytochrome b subunit